MCVSAGWHGMNAIATKKSATSALFFASYETTKPLNLGAQPLLITILEKHIYDVIDRKEVEGLIFALMKAECFYSPPSPPLSPPSALSSTKLKA